MRTSSTRTWVILGATSIIAEAFAHLAAKQGHALLLVARDQQQLSIIAADIQLRYRINCDIMVVDFAKDIHLLLHRLKNQDTEWDLLVAHSFMHENKGLSPQIIEELITINITSTLQVIQAYWQKKQKQHQLLFLSSVAACRGRSKNSLYGASKMAIEIYLQGLQQAASTNQHITIARLGYIDTRSTYGKPGIFYASAPNVCAKVCWQALIKKKNMIYHPSFWQLIMGVMQRLPWRIYRKLGRM